MSQPKTPEAMNALAVLCQSAPSLDETLRLYAAGGTTALGGEERKSLIEASRAGQHVELEFEAITYYQRAGSQNRNFIRFRPGAMKALAKSGKGTPFLRDHAQRSQADRGGTVIASTAEKMDDGAIALRQRIRLTTPWAVQGALEGTIDRFSIGWHPTGELHCTACKASWTKCSHWPGDKIDDESVVELEYQEAELVEVSSVNVPAVVQTGITDQIRAALTLARQPTLAREEAAEMNPKELAKRLGLPESASEDEIFAALEAVNRERSELALERTALQADRVAGAVDQAVQLGRIPAEHREIYQSFGLAHGVDKLKEKLTASPEGRFGPPRESTVLKSAPGSDPVRTTHDEVSPTIAAYMKQTGRTLDQIKASDEQNPALKQVLNHRARA